MQNPHGLHETPANDEQSKCNCAQINGYVLKGDVAVGLS